MIKEIDLSELPIFYPHGRKSYNWNLCYNKEVNFRYSNIEGKIRLLDYNSNNQTIKIEYNNKINSITLTNLKLANLGKVIGFRTSDFKIEIGDSFKSKKCNIIITDREVRKSNNEREEREKWYKYTCLKCGWTEGWIEEYNLNAGRGCSCCGNSKVIVPEINSIYKTDPWMIKYFVNSEDAKIYSRGSSLKLQFKCPDCGRLKNKKISDLTKNKSLGCSCSDNISYPNKFMRNILEQIKANFVSEFYPNWCKFDFKGKIRSGRYDFYFELNNKKYIVEMDGAFHFINNKVSGQTKEESIIVDSEKDRLALENNIEMIRIDYQISDHEFIKNNILKSKLNEIFDLSKIDWNKVEEYALSNRNYNICKYYSNNPFLSTKEIGKIFNITDGTVSKILNKGNKVKWCNYDTDKIESELGRKMGLTKAKPFSVLKDGKTIKSYRTINECSLNSLKDFNVYFNTRYISLCLLNKKENYKGYIFKRL